MLSALSGNAADSLLSSFIIDEMWPMCVVNTATTLDHDLNLEPTKGFSYRRQS